MAGIVTFNTAFGTVQAFAYNNGLINQRCPVLNTRLLCGNFSQSLFNQRFISLEALGIAHSLGIKMDTSDCYQNIMQKKGDILTKYKAKLEANADKAANVVDKQNYVIITTGDLKEPYEVLGPVYFQVSNKGIFSSDLSKLVKKYSDKIAVKKAEGMMGQAKNDWGFLYGEFSVGQKDFDKAFFVGCEELKFRCASIGGDAIICMRQDIDLDTTNIAHFYMQMYGTAVRFIEQEVEEETENN